VEGNITDGAGRRGDGGEGKWEKQEDLEIREKIARLRANAVNAMTAQIFRED
jgi:hypothetical protein